MAPKKRCSKKKKTEAVILVKQRNNLMMKMTERQKALMKKRTERQKRPWSDLPADLLMDILAKNYSPADQIRFHAVCKSWQQLPIDQNNAESATDNLNKLPWVVTWDWTDNLGEEEEEYSCVLNCKLFDPKHPNPYSVNKFLFQDRRSNQRTRICSSNHGWLLFEKEKHINLTSYFMFSPFTQQFIHLPDLDNVMHGLKPSSSHATFSSSDPYNDSDCEFFVVRDFCESDCYRIAISTCRRGDQNWTTQVFGNRVEVIQLFFTGPIQQVLYTQQRYLCCLSQFGSLVAYRVTRKDWIQLVIPLMHLLLYDDQMFDGRPQLIECQEGLLLVTVRNSRFNDGGCRIFKFSWWSSNWNVESSLPNQAIFIGPTSFLVPASGNIANKIYYHDLASKSLKFYCLKERKSHKYLRAAAAAADDSSLYRGWLPEGMMPDGVWIQSPQLHSHEAF